MTWNDPNGLSASELRRLVRGLYSMLDSFSLFIEASQKTLRKIEGKLEADPDRPNSLGEEILRALHASPGGLTRSEINGLFDRNKASSEINRALMALHNSGLVGFEKVPTKGRPAERWFAVGDLQDAPNPSGATTRPRTPIRGPQGAC